MFETWKLMDFAPGEGKEREVFQPGYDDRAWIDVPVPGDVHKAYQAAGKIPDPFYDRNEDEVAWMEQREFWYRTTFRATGGRPDSNERVLLTFHGLDTFAVIYLNGKLLGRAQNMFREFVFDVSDKLIWAQDNVIAVRFDPPLSHINPNDPFKSTWGPNMERVYMRKAQYGYGWDWGPRLPTIGIWRPVELRRHKMGALLGAQFATLRIDNGGNPVLPGNSVVESALVMVKVEASRFVTDQPLKVEIRLAAPGEKKPLIDGTLDLERQGSYQQAIGYSMIPNPRLWWTNDLGEPYLYDLRITLRKGKEVLDVIEQKVGIRTLTLDQQPDPDEFGTRFFRFILNGSSIFAKGADWIPADSFVGGLEDDRYERLLTLARDANMNMLRIWGGGIYEHDIFYNLCDRLGILVWQDFMFACAQYPETSAYAAEVDAEARYQIRRLRSHPCLALWCGNNENQWIEDQRFPDKSALGKALQKVPGALYYDTTLPNAVDQMDGITHYWPGSPYGGNDHNSMEEGDRHNWTAWHGLLPRRFGEPQKVDQSPEGVSYRHFAEDMGRFISEFGMHAAPVFETLRRVIPEDQRYHHSPSMDHHNKDNPKNKGDNLMETVTGLPKDLDEYIDFSMIAQAEGLKFGIEHFRRRTPHCSGTLIWQLNDCWPVLSWSLVDYYGFGKAGYFYAKRVFAPVLASFREEADGGVSLWFTNDRLEPFHQGVRVRLVTLGGKGLWEEMVEVNVPATSSQEVARWTAEQLGPAPDRVLWAEPVGEPADAFPANRHFFAAIKDLRREPASVEMTVTPVSEHEVEVELTAQGYAYFVHLTQPSEFTRYSDNYFDMLPARPRKIRVWNERSPLDPQSLQLAWR